MGFNGSFDVSMIFKRVLSAFNGFLMVSMGFL